MTEGFDYWQSRKKEDVRFDWRNGGDDWISEYWKSKEHPHRRIVVEAVKSLLPAESLLEIGSNCGPNLSNIKHAFPELELMGVDANHDAIMRGKRNAKGIEFTLGNFLTLPWKDKSYDIVLADAVLMYVNKKDIIPCMIEIDRVCRKGLVFLEWFSPSLTGTVRNYHWARNYAELLKRLGFYVDEYKITKDDWPSQTWIKNGRLYIARRQ